MIEENILKAVSRVTGISVDDMRSQSRLANVSEARMLFYYICSEKGLTQSAIAKAIGKSRQAVSIGLLTYKKRFDNNKRHKKLVGEVRGFLLGLGLGKEYDRSVAIGQGSVYIGGDKYSIVDISSRYTGSGYMGTVNDVPVLYSESKEDAVRRLIKMAE